MLLHTNAAMSCDLITSTQPITKAEELYRFEVNEYKNKLETQSIVSII